MFLYSVCNTYKPPRAHSVRRVNKCLILADSREEAEQIFLKNYTLREGYGVNVMQWDEAKKGIIWTYK